MRVKRAVARKISQLEIDQNIAMAGYVLTGLGAGSANGQSLRYQQAILEAILTLRGDLLFRGASTAERLAKGTTGYLLKQGANDPEWGTSPIEAIVTTRGDILFRGASALARLAKGSSGQYLKQGSNDPEWANKPCLTNIPLFPMLTEETPTTISFGYDGLTKLAHSIKHPEAVSISRVAVYVDSITGDPSDMTCEIWSDSGGSPSAVITNGSIAIAQGSIVEGAMNWFVFATPPSLTANTLYWVVLYMGNPTDSDYYVMKGYDGVPTYGAGIWGVGTQSKKYSDTTWASEKPVLDIIMGYKT